MPLELVTVEEIISGSGGNDVLIFNTIADLEAYNIETVSPITQGGALAFVLSVRDYFRLDRSWQIGSRDGITVANSAPVGHGLWYRLNMGHTFWQHQSGWTVDPSLGSDEATGSVAAPLRTVDEFERRVAFNVGANGFANHALFVTSSTTTSATPLSVMNYPQPASSLCKFKVDAFALTGSFAAAASGFVEATYIRSGSSAPSLVGSQQLGADSLGTASGWGMSIAPSGNNVAFAITGSASSTIEWGIVIDVERVTF